MHQDRFLLEKIDCRTKRADIEYIRVQLAQFARLVARFKFNIPRVFFIRGKTTGREIQLFFVVIIRRNRKERVVGASVLYMQIMHYLHT